MGGVGTVSVISLCCANVLHDTKVFDVGSNTKPTLQGPAEFSTAYLAHISGLGAIASSCTSIDMLECAQRSHEL